MVRERERERGIGGRLRLCVCVSERKIERVSANEKECEKRG